MAEKPAEDNSNKFTGELNIEDLEFLSEEQPEMIAGGSSFLNVSLGGLDLFGRIRGELSGLERIFRNIFDL